MVKIELKNIRYVQNKQLILDNINLIIEDKEYCAFVGPTGAGKTSLIGIISGLYRPSAGQVLFNGKDVTNLLHSLQNYDFEGSEADWTGILLTNATIIDQFLTGKEKI